MPEFSVVLPSGMVQHGAWAFDERTTIGDVTRTMRDHYGQNIDVRVNHEARLITLTNTPATALPVVPPPLTNNWLEVLRENMANATTQTPFVPVVTPAPAAATVVPPPATAPAAAPAHVFSEEDRETAPSLHMSGRTVQIGGQNWRFFAQRGSTAARRPRTILLESAPAKGWMVGDQIHTRSLNNWKKNPSFYLDPELRFLVNRDIPCAYVFREWKPMYRVLIQEALGIVDVPAVAPAPEAQIQSLHRLLLGAKRRWLDDEKRTLRMREDNVQNYRRSLIDAERQKRASQAAVDSYVLPKEEEAKDLLERTAALQGVEKVEISGEELWVFTEFVQIEAALAPDGSKRKTVYNIGKFKVRIHLNAGAVYFHNLTAPGYQNFQHPHVKEPERPCFGDIAVSIAELVSALALPELVRTLLHYLRSVNVDDGHGALIRYWPVAQAMGNTALAAPQPPQGMAQTIRAEWVLTNTTNTGF